MGRGGFSDATSECDKPVCIRTYHGGDITGMPAVAMTFGLPAMPQNILAALALPAYTVDAQGRLMASSGSLPPYSASSDEGDEELGEGAE